MPTKWHDRIKAWWGQGGPQGSPSVMGKAGDGASSEALWQTLKEKIVQGAGPVLPPPEAIMRHVHDDLRSMLLTVSLLQGGKPVTRWPEKEPALVWEGCAFHPCAVDGVPALLVVWGKKWFLWREAPPDWRRDSAGIWACARWLHTQESCFPSQPSGSSVRILNKAMPITHKALLEICQDLCQHGRQVVAISAFSSLFTTGPVPSALLHVHSVVTGGEVWSVGWRGDGIACVPVSSNAQGAIPRPVYRLDAATFADVAREWRLVFQEIPGLRHLLGEEEKRAPKMFYVAPPVGRKVREVRAPSTPQEARAIVDDVGVIVPSRARYLPKSSGKGRGRPRVYGTQTVKGYLHLSVRGGKTGGMEVFLALDPEGPLRVLEVVQHLHPPTPEEVGQMVGVIEEAFVHIPLLGGSAGARWRAAHHAYLAHGESIKAATRQKALDLWGETWSAWEAARARAIASRAIPEGALVLRWTGDRFMWSFKMPRDPAAETMGSPPSKDKVYLVPANRVPSLDALHAHISTAGLSAHRALSALSRCQNLPAYVCADERLSDLRWPVERPLPSHIGFDPLWWDLLERFAPRETEAAAPGGALGKICLFHTGGPYSKINSGFFYRAGVLQWDPDRIPWEARFRGRAKPGGASAPPPSKPSYDLFVVAFLGMFCSRRGRRVLEEMGVESYRFRPVSNVEGVFSIEVEESKEDLHPHPKMRPAHGASDPRWQMPSTYDSQGQGDLAGTPLALEGGPLWRSSVVAPYAYTPHAQVFACSGALMEACRAAGLKVAEHLEVPVLPENPYASAVAALGR